MQTVVKDLLIQLADDCVMIKDAKTLELLKAKCFKPHEAVDKYNEIVKIYQKKTQK